MNSAQQNPKFQETLRICEANYWPWEKLRFAVRGADLDPELVWIFSQISPAPRYRTLPLFGHDDVPLRFNMPDALQHELMLIDQQLAGGLTSADDLPPSATQRERFIVSSFQEEAIASSMLEGAVTTRQEAKQMLKTGRCPRTRGEQMVVNNYQAIQLIREHSDVDLSVDFVLESKKY